MTTARPRPEADVLVLIATGGAIGSVLRYVVEAWVPAAGSGGFPWGTLAVNVAGSFALGLLHAYVPAHPRMPRRVRAVLGAGLLGGFTTFSAYAVQTRTLLADGHDVQALAYLLGTLAAAVVAVEAGRLVAPGRGR
jgi:fluoride exporter